MAKNQDCIFCKIAQGKIPAKKIKETDNFFAVYDKFPITKGHTLIIPKKHFVTVLDIPNSLGSELIKIIKDVASDLMDKKLGDGFNLVMNNLEPAGQAVMHAHIHIIPRKEKDGFKMIA
ncbi:MAG: HIT domain-containing protein [Nanoarchaeota archaeon]|nr:HIT domain-containing protein [Nanoarchaeota archaeon]MBU1103324.1 HIT domain-containing protein [Nanoarchaeota archaeon]